MVIAMLTGSHAGSARVERLGASVFGDSLICDGFCALTGHLWTVQIKTWCGIFYFTSTSSVNEYRER